MFNHPKLKLMINPSEIEQGAVSQIAQCLDMKGLEKLVICPDVHQGYDIPIGAAALMKGYVWPGAVGYDINCVDCDTEFLSPNGWVKIVDFSGEKVMQFEPKDGSAEFVTPLNYIVEDCEEFIHFKTRGVDQMLSPGHRSLVYKFDRDYKFDKFGIESAQSIFDTHQRLKLGYRNKFMTAFTPKIDTSVEFNDDALRVMVMLSADCALTKHRAVLRLKKKRKIDRAKKLLSNCNIPFTESLQKSGVTYISFEPPANYKGLENFWRANHHQLEIIVDEIFYWDGNLESKCFYTRRKQEADFIHYAISATGKRASLREDVHKGDGKVDYRVFVIDNPLVGIYGSPKTEMQKVKSIDGKMYCFTVPSSFLVLRRNGHVFTTGNCGMSFINTGLTLGQLDLVKYEDRLSFFNELQKAVPLLEQSKGTGARFDKFPNGANDKNYANAIFAKANKQLGTLGSGNHFVSLVENSADEVGLVLHTGSRKPGWLVADYWMKKAKSSGESNNGLWMFPFKSELGQGYLADMHWAYDWAHLNRELIMKSVLELLSLDWAEESKGLINETHNTATVLDDEGTILYRKGATPADDGTYGIIPGNMRDGVFVVKGLGNKEYLSTCSHGAGRRLSRGKAKKQVDWQKLVEEMKSLDILVDICEANCDESPEAYKDLWQVVKTQENIVIEVVDYFQPKIVRIG